MVSEPLVVIRKTLPAPFAPPVEDVPYRLPSLACIKGESGPLMPNEWIVWSTSAPETWKVARKRTAKATLPVEAIPDSSLHVLIERMD